jgi:hypothetical protein
MLVERLTVCSLGFEELLLAANINQGVGYITLQIGAGGDQRVHQNLDIFDDRRTQTPQIPPTTLRAYDRTVREVVGGR